MSCSRAALRAAKSKWGILVPRNPAVIGLAVAAALFAPPAYALDDDLEDPNACSGVFGGGDVPSGTVVSLPAGSSPSGLPGPVVVVNGQPLSNTYICVAGHWVYVPTALEIGLQVAADAQSVTVDEGSAATMSGTYSYPGDEPVSLEASLGVLTDHADGTWSWSFTPDDGPATHTVTITVIAGYTHATAEFELHVENVAPTVTSLAASATMVLPGQPVELTGTATDPSGSDTAAGFSWSVEGPVTFDTCGAHTIEVTATDKDGGISAPAAASVDVIDAWLDPPLTSGAFNVVRPGQVVPVRFSVGCAGATVSGLTPTISLVVGAVDPETTSGDPALLVPPADVTGDTTGVMKEVAGFYQYNLRVPDGPPGSLYTIQISPWPGAGPSSAVLKLR